ncbi:hypothetical protein GOL29_03210 [Sinorhizobium medicae]|nr:hypothetical protein [Sinorhizobium medicae]
MTDIEFMTQAFAAFFLIFWASHTTATSGSAVAKIVLYVGFKALPIMVGGIFAFNLYIDILGKLQ